MIHFSHCKHCSLHQDYGGIAVVLKEQINDWLKLYATEKRRAHALGVAETALDLAAKHGADPDKAYAAGILHDLARDYPAGELLARAEHFHIPVGYWEKSNPVVLHGPVAASVVKERLGMQDEEILEAIRVHTLGAPHMSPVAKIVYLADIIEPGRKFDGVEYLRRLAAENMDCALLAAMDGTINYLLQRKVIIHPKTVEVRNYILMSRLSKEGKI